ncbi:NADPH:quinone oxidoreductase family protein [Algoriphagus sp.]|uniref:NADPH:quinone oxidoreductase family protein n=1 Tax=Algoriphagus sp. TaxID=1872435 RepID=UPI0025E6DB5F|nr:NADPH:quinone oxidoreductase family protein [Algoriphagus sp.]
MKAIICEKFGPPENLKFGELPNPLPDNDQVLVKVEACGINFPDILIIQNKYQFKPELPFSPGGEVVGEVIGLGEKVENLKLGDSVLAICGWGGLAEQVAVDSNRVFKLQDRLDKKLAAATLYNYGTSFHALKDRGKLKEGETLLVLGASGGVGLAAVELGKIMGAKVIAAASTNEKLQLCRDRGADDTINYEQEDLKQKIKDLTNDKGVDIVFDPVGGKYTEPALRGIAWKGRYLIVGFSNGEIPKIPMNLPLLKGCEIVGVFWGRFSNMEPEQNFTNILQLQSWLLEGKIKGPRIQEYSLSNASSALEALLDRKKFNKGVVMI